MPTATMNNVAAKLWKPFLTLLMGAAAWAFWSFRCVSGLSFQEQNQLFLTTRGYFFERLSAPGGLADYVGEFLVQFYYVPVIGALIIALLYMSVQGLTWLLARRDGASDAYYPLSFLPALALWSYMGDANVLMAFPVALAAVLFFCLFSLSRVSFFLLLPFLYWLFGPAVYVLVAIFVLHRLLRKNFVWPCVALVWMVAIVLLISRLLPYPLSCLFTGLSYYRFPLELPYMQLVTWLLAAVVPVVLGLLPRPSRPFVPAVGLSLLMAVGGFFFVRSAFDRQVYELLDYQYYVRREQWGNIVRMAERRQPQTPVGVASLNLALGQTGQLADRLFEFYQNGAEGLFPSFQRDFTSTVVLSEVFFHLGFINDAQHYAFEAQEALPNYRKSARLTRRLAETNLINGDYQVAAKYLRMLQHTLFYRSWATRTLALLGHEKTINAHPLYGRLRSLRQHHNDYLYSDRELDQMLGLLFTENHANRMAFEYLMCYELLQGDLQHFAQYYPLGQYAGFDHIPMACQQALVFNWMQTHTSFDGMTVSVSPMVKQQAVQFLQLSRSNPNDPQLTAGPLARTLWGYLYRYRTAPSDSSKETSKPIY